MMIVMGTARMGPGEIDRLQPALTAYIERVRERDGCISYNYARDLNDPDLLHIIEQWRDDEAIDAHMAQMSDILDVLGGARIESLKVPAYEAQYKRTLVGE